MLKYNKLKITHVILSHLNIYNKQRIIEQRILFRSVVIEYRRTEVVYWYTVRNNISAFYSFYSVSVLYLHFGFVKVWEINNNVCVKNRYVTRLSILVHQNSKIIIKHLLIFHKYFIIMYIIYIYINIP